MSGDKSTLVRRYFNWLCENLNIDAIPGVFKYKTLITDLFKVAFKPYFGLDNDRVKDAMRLRELFCEYAKCDISLFQTDPITIFEVMVALAIRGEVHIMSNPDHGDRTAKWFYKMLSSLGLLQYTDDEYRREEVLDILSRFLNHEYEPNGKGGLFECEHPQKDMRTLDIWQQMCFWFDEVLEKEGYFK